MTDRPIIFSAPMIRALLEGRKTQTRRVVKNVPEMPTANCHPAFVAKHPAPYLDAYCGERVTPANPRGMSRDWHWWQVDDRCGPRAFRLPYAPGDRLWVQEAWRSASAYDDLSPSAMGGEEPIRYEADEAWMTWGWGVPLRVGRFRSSMHMPRWASRLTLTVTDVRVQRLWRISADDVHAEGCEWGVNGGAGDYRNKFRELWKTIHGPEAWDANPWVAVISFTVRQGNIDT